MKIKKQVLRSPLNFFASTGHFGWVDKATANEEFFKEGLGEKYLTKNQLPQ